MELLDVIKGRKSIRGFKSDPVPRELIEDILKNALWAPSWGNTQSWEIVVIGHELLKKISEELVEKVMGGVPVKPDLPMPDSWPPKNKRRYVDVGRDLFATLGIQRGDKEARMDHYLNMYRFFGAPNAIYICMHKDINKHYGPFDLGALSSNICMLAYERGLGTCIMAVLSHYPDIVRKYANISDDMSIVIGIAIGYPDEDNPSYSFKSTRDEDVISWQGF